MDEESSSEDLSSDLDSEVEPPKKHKSKSKGSEKTSKLKKKTDKNEVKKASSHSSQLVSGDFNVNNFVTNPLLSMNDVQSAIIIIAEKQRHQDASSCKSAKHKAKAKKSKHSKVKKREAVESSSSSECNESGSQSSDEEVEVLESSQSNKGKFKLCTIMKATNEKLKSQELSTQTVLEDDELKDFDLKDLPFNLLVAGELEIILGYDILEKEKFSQLEVLKNIAYNMDELGARSLCGNFIRKIEKEKFKWDSRSDVREFDRQVNYKACRSRQNKEDTTSRVKVEKSRGKYKGKEDKPFYCLDFNRNSCSKSESHCGKLPNGKSLFKQHICKKCLEDDTEKRHSKSYCMT